MIDKLMCAPVYLLLSFIFQGRAASEIDTGDELLASELMFNGTFGALDKHQLAAVVSCLVPVENTNVRAAYSPLFLNLERRKE